MFAVSKFCVFLYCLTQVGVVFCVHLVFLVVQIIHKETQVHVGYAQIVP